MTTQTLGTVSPTPTPSHDKDSPQAAKEAVADLAKDTQQQNEAIAGDAARVAELAPPIDETPPPRAFPDGEFVVTLMEPGEDPEIVFQGAAADCLDWARKWLREPLGISVTITPPAETYGGNADETKSAEATHASNDENQDEAADDDDSCEVEPVVSEKLACLPQPGDVLWISASCMEALKPFNSALRVRVLKVRDLHEKPLTLSEYHSRWWTTPFDRIQIVGEVVSEGWKKGNRHTFWIPGPHQAESPTLSFVEWPIEEGQIKQFGPEFDSCEYSRCTLIMAARKLLQRGDGQCYRIMPAIPQEA